VFVAALQGSGKTLAFGIPILNRLLTVRQAIEDKGYISAVIGPLVIQLIMSCMNLLILQETCFSGASGSDPDAHS